MCCDNGCIIDLRVLKATSFTVFVGYSEPLVMVRFGLYIKFVANCFVWGLPLEVCTTIEWVYNSNLRKKSSTREAIHSLWQKSEKLVSQPSCLS